MSREELLTLRDELFARAEQLKSGHGWVPHKPTPKQAQFLALETREAFYGGAAGGGKSDCLLMFGLEVADVPGSAALLFRRTYPELHQAGGLIPRSHAWLAGSAAAWNGDKKMWTFPSGAILQFGHLEHENDVHKYQGGEWQRIGFDELTHFSEAQYLYLRSRNRRVRGCPLQPRQRGAGNPGGPGHAWVKRRFVEPGDESRPFVSAKIEDNPHLDAEEYREALSNLDHTKRRQLEFGEWVTDASTQIYPFGPQNIIETVPDWGEGGWHYGLGLDLGASVQNPTVGCVVVGWHDEVPDGVWVLEAHVFAGGAPHLLEGRIRRLEERYGGFDFMVEDEGALGVAIGDELRERYGVAVDAAQKRGKAAYRSLLIGAIQKGNLLIVGPACAPLLEEAAALMWDRDGLDSLPGLADHVTDALLYAWRGAKAFRGRVPATKHDKGSPEWAEKERQRELDEARRKALRKRELAFWQRK